MTFEDFLVKKHHEENQEILDDDLSDAFNTWLERLDNQEIIDYAEEWGKEVKKEIKELEKEVEELDDAVKGYEEDLELKEIDRL